MYLDMVRIVDNVNNCSTEKQEAVSITTDVSEQKFPSER